jgi:hypothetical protein
VLLNSVLLNFSHILIRHAGITSEQAAFSPGDWFVPYPKVTRSEAEALALIRALTDRIRGGESFAEVAREYSEDPLTGARGGYLGSQSAAQFVIWPDVLDALAQSPIGHVTQPILTDTGFQIFVRHPPPSPSTLSGRRLVIGHIGAPWLRYNARGKLVQRTREEAWAIASRLHQDLESNSEAFDAKVRELSEHWDAERGGDIGEWSSLEPSPVWLELQILSELEIGQVSKPVDGAFGIEILQRTPTRGRAVYAASILRLPFHPETAPAEQNSELLVFNRARQLAVTLARDPQTFSRYQDELCCRGVQRVVAGRDWTPLEIALSVVEAGTVYTRPVLGEASQYWVVKREQEVPPKPAISFDLPNPMRPDVPWFVAEDGHLADRAVKRVSESIAELALTGDTVLEVRQQLASMGQLKELAPPARLHRLEVCAERVQHLLSSGDYSRFLRLVDREFEHLLLAPD